MFKDPELAALIEQAGRNLNTLELLIGAHSRRTIESLRQRIQRLRDEYTRETNNLTQQVLRRAIERRRGGDRRRGSQTGGAPEPAPESEAPETG